MTRGLEGEPGCWWWPPSHQHWGASQGFSPQTPCLHLVLNTHTYTHEFTHSPSHSLYTLFTLNIHTYCHTHSIRCHILLTPIHFIPSATYCSHIVTSIVMYNTHTHVMYNIHTRVMYNTHAHCHVQYSCPLSCATLTTMYNTHTHCHALCSPLHHFHTLLTLNIHIYCHTYSTHCHSYTLTSSVTQHSHTYITHCSHSHTHT